jgi:ferrochelatase
MTLPEHIHSRSPRRGVLLVNLGTPEAPSASAIRRYLREFLSDRRVVELSRWLWWPVLNAFILPLRPLKLQHSYAAIWTADGSPLLAISRRQQRALQAALGPELPVALAMRYGKPSIDAALAELAREDVRRVLLLPLYPQYSATTTASVFDAVADSLRRWRWLPELRTVHQYHDDAGYIEALARSVEAQWESKGRGEHLLMSFHSIPLSYVLAGDPYFCHCQKTARLLAERLGLEASQWSVSFQSRLGRTAWLQPYTEPHVQALAKQGCRRLDVICPGFAADCLETLEELALRYAARFRAAGGSELRYIPALNDAPAHIDALKALIERQLAGWEYPPETRSDVENRLERAARISPTR